MDRSRDLGVLIGRILLVAIFVLSGASKIGGFTGTAGYMASAGIPQKFVTPLLIVTILIELGGGLLIIAGFQTRIASLIIFLWLIPVTLIFHFFPAREGHQAMINTIMYMKNLSMMGGLLILASVGAGAYSIDGLSQRPNAMSARRVAA
jgi:putative oxidoreductase